jgi:hypothetical protein
MKFGPLDDRVALRRADDLMIKTEAGVAEAPK